MKLDASTTKRGLDAIDRNTRIQAQLIEDLLDVSRIITGKLVLERDVIDLVDVAQAAAEGLRAPALARQLDLAVTAEGAKLTLWLNGETYATLATGLPALNAPFTIGKEKPAEGAEPGASFVGEIDELQIAKIARPAGWLKLAALSQGGGDKTAKLVLCAEDEQAKHGGEMST